MSLQLGERITDGRCKIAPMVAFSGVRLEERCAIMTDGRWKTASLFAFSGVRL